MKKNLKYLIIAHFLFFASYINAQILGLRSGINLTTIANNIKGEGKTDHLVTKIGFNAGLSLKLPLCSIFSIESGVLLSNKGYLQSENLDKDYPFKENFNTYYLEVPLMLRGSCDIGGPRLILQAGSYIAMGIGVSKTQEFIENGEYIIRELDIKWGSEDKNISQFDFGLNFGTGIEFNNFQFIVNYGLGLSNLIPNKDSSYYMKNRVLSFTLGYNFNKKE